VSLDNEETGICKKASHQYGTDEAGSLKSRAVKGMSEKCKSQVSLMQADKGTGRTSLARSAGCAERRRNLMEETLRRPSDVMIQDDGTHNQLPVSCRACTCS